MRVVRPGSITETRRVIEDFVAADDVDAIVIAPPNDARFEILWLIASQYCRAGVDNHGITFELACGTYALDGKCHCSIHRCLGAGRFRGAEVKRVRTELYDRYRRSITRA